MNAIESPGHASAPADPLVRLQGVDKAFDRGPVVLQGIDLDIHEGDFLCLLGPSGCGKSTVLRLIAALTAPTGGQLRWNASARLTGSGKPDVGFVFQEPTLMPWATVAENVYLPFKLKDRPRQDVQGRIDEVLALVGLTDAAQAYPRQLSGGMKMRASIARAIVTRPRLLLMDEPFAALDEITRTRLNRDLANLWQQLGCTIVFVTHSVVESVQLASRIAVMAARPGRIVGELPGLADRQQARPTAMDARTGAHCEKVSQLLDLAMSGSAALRST